MKSVWVERLVEPARDKETGNRGTRKGKSHNREGKRAGSGRSNARAKQTRQRAEASPHERAARHTPTKHRTAQNARKPGIPTKERHRWEPGEKSGKRTPKATTVKISTN